MKSSEKMLTFEEWYNECQKTKIAQEKFNLARQGMMPIPEAVGFEEFRRTKGDYLREYDEGVWNIAQDALLSDPLVVDLRGVEWKPDTKYLAVVEVAGTDHEPHYNLDAVMKITRPTPAWQPKEGEAVLFCDDELDARTVVTNAVPKPDPSSGVTPAQYLAAMKKRHATGLPYGRRVMSDLLGISERQARYIISELMACGWSTEGGEVGK